MADNLSVFRPMQRPQQQTVALIWDRRAKNRHTSQLRLQFLASLSSRAVTRVTRLSAQAPLSKESYPIRWQVTLQIRRPVDLGQDLRQGQGLDLSRDPQLTAIATQRAARHSNHRLLDRTRRPRKTSRLSRHTAA